MKKTFLNVVLLVLGMNCYSNNTLPSNVSLLSYQDYQQDSRFAYIEHRGRREWIRVTITFEKQEGQEKWKAVKALKEAPAAAGGPDAAAAAAAIAALQRCKRRLLNPYVIGTAH